MLLRRVSFALLGLAWLVGFAPAARAEESFPYRAWVRTDDVYVRSGPGENYYPVMKVGRGDVVEVYRHDPGGWYAVRPPEGSYSWVAAEFITPTGHGRGQVSGQHVMARVGSSFSDVRDVIQVRLDQGEHVEILEARKLETENGLQTWYKIAPPAGEFRWISGKYVSQDLPTIEERAGNAKNNLIIAKLARDEREAGGRQRDDRSATEYAPSSITRDDQEAIARQRARQSASAGKPTIGVLDRLDTLDLELSTEVAQAPTDWNFAKLRDEAERMLAKSETPVERGQARLLLAKIDRFEDIRNRYTSSMASAGQTELRRQELAARAPRPSDPTAPAAPDPRYDGTGKLAQVVSRRAGGPQFALLDRNGAIRSYVSASPGVNLRNYVGREIGVSGSLGYLSEEKASHVTAKRVTVIDGGTLR
ncbi:MAG: SH3 domain-containing protein [Planctomycetes bacterium]|nr:SH3 domain-containing protein [Planctomycetota bacterium]